MTCPTVVVHFDCDAFYAQCEEVRDPTLAVRPLGVTQKYLIVTCNYPARQRGVCKLMAIKDAVQRCPDLVLINGEDLTPYRRASKRVLTILQRFGEAEKLGMDEVLVDVTEEVKRRLSQGTARRQWCGHVHRSSLGVIQENRHRVMDLRAGKGQACDPPAEDGEEALDVQQPLLGLMVGSQVAAEARAALKTETGFRSSAGIAGNRMLAKLCSGLHKPDDQTVLPPEEAMAFMAPLPLRAIPGVGSKLGAQLKELGIELIEELRRISQPALVAKFGERIGCFLYQAARAEDPTVVKAKQPPKAITVEDSFKSCTSTQAVKHILQILAPDLVARLQEEYQECGRRPKTLTLKWRHKKDGWSRSSASCTMPPAVQVHKEGPDQAQVEAVVAAALSLFTRNNKPVPFVLTLLNLGACNFTSGGSGGSAPMPAAFARFLKAKPDSQPEDAAGLQTNDPADTSKPELHRGPVIVAESRRDYGHAPSGPPISKVLERSLREQRRLLQGSAAAATDAPSDKAAASCVPAISAPFCVQRMPADADLQPQGAMQRTSLSGTSAIAASGEQPAELDSRDHCDGGSTATAQPPEQVASIIEQQLDESIAAGEAALPPPERCRDRNFAAKDLSAYDQELQKLRLLLGGSGGADAGDLHPDAVMARKLQETELSIRPNVSHKKKRPGVGPLDSFFKKRSTKADGL